MAKINKSLYSKDEWHTIREQRKAKKQQLRNLKNLGKSNTKRTSSLPEIKNTAFVIGNGTSRKNIKLESLRDFGTIYGCNALYRDFDPDVLVAVDTKMILELNKARYQHRVPVWTNPNKSYEKMSGFNFFNPSKGWSSGPTALWKASEDGFETIYIVGFDYKGIGDQYDKVNNVYAGTFNYKKTNERATYYGNWLKQTVSTIQKNHQKRYIRVLEKNGFIPKEFSKLENLTHISVEDFQKSFNSF